MEVGKIKGRSEVVGREFLLHVETQAFRVLHHMVFTGFVVVVDDDDDDVVVVVVVVVDVFFFVFFFVVVVVVVAASPGRFLHRNRIKEHSTGSVSTRLEFASQLS